MFIRRDSTHPSTFMKTNRSYQLPLENLPTSLHEKPVETMEKPKTPLASPIPNNPTKEFGHLHEIQDICLDFAFVTKQGMEFIKKYEESRMKQTHTLSPPFGTPKMGGNLRSTTYVMLMGAIVQMIKTMPRSNVNIDCFKRVTMKNHIQVILVLG